MSKRSLYGQYSKIHTLTEKFRFLFFWLNFFYPKAGDLPITYQLYCLFPQKIWRINGRVPWPVHFTSRILWYDKVEIGNNSSPGLSGCCYIQARNGIIIGNNFRMGPGCGLISANHKDDDYDLHTEDLPIIIGDNVWLGMNVVVLPGVRIGDNVIVSANSVVRSDIPSNVISGGSPCKVIKQKSPYTGKNYSENFRQ